MDKKKILIVDDEVDMVDILSVRFEANNYSVITASDGESALEKVQREKPDAIILDVMMPQMDGLAVLKKIREKDEKLPIFIFTAFSNEERVKIAEKYNATGFIIKTNDLQGEIDKITATLKIADKYKNKPK